MGVFGRFVAEHLNLAAGELLVAAPDETGHEDRGVACQHWHKTPYADVRIMPHVPTVATVRRRQLPRQVGRRDGPG
jgi:hypothetical protein